MHDRNSKITNLTWLGNKLTVLAPFIGTSTHPSNDGHSITCEYALATRMLLEEQALGAGQSNRCTGKYASQFRPLRTCDNDNHGDDGLYAKGADRDNNQRWHI
mmetsp:Transcript_15069/g.42529  ORF Transcript_15069/g.42529 Transcript_15069/m.42529 type:complete len:103 (-) Transcript_15069:967-1275(-)